MKRIALFTIAIVAMTLSAMAATSEGTNNFTIKRGTNVSHWLSQSNERGVARRLHIQEDDFARLAQLGRSKASSHQITRLGRQITPTHYCRSTYH